MYHCCPVLERFIRQAKQKVYYELLNFVTMLRFKKNTI